MTDLWFDYEPVRRKGVRKYEFLYIFIKYKTKEEMKRSVPSMKSGRILKPKLAESASPAA